MTTKLHLIIAPLNDSGQIMALNPQEFTDLGPCTIEEYGKRMDVVTDSMKVAAQLNSLHIENAMRTKQIFEGLIYSGIITQDGIKAEGFLKPYFMKFIREHEMTKTFWARWRDKQKERTKLFFGNLKIIGMKILSKYGTQATLFFKSKFGR